MFLCFMQLLAVLLAFCPRALVALSSGPAGRPTRRSFLGTNSGAAMAAVFTQSNNALNPTSVAAAAAVDPSSQPSISSAAAPLLPPPDYIGAYSIPKSFAQLGSWQPPPAALTTKLGQDRILAQELSPLQQFALPFGGNNNQETYYPQFLLGSWNVRATLKSKMYPYGTAFVPFPSLVEGSPRNRNEQVGDSTEYQVHYFSTLANTQENQWTVNLGLGVPQSKIIADRAFNAIELSKAYRQLAPVQEVDWDYSKDPTRYTVLFGAGMVADDLRPLGPRRGEVYLTARASEEDTTGNLHSFCAAERSRSVTLATATVVVSDMEYITEFRQTLDNEDHVSAVSRIVVYLTPNPNSREGVLWQQVGGKAVAFFDYELDMQRQREKFKLDDGSTIERACVPTPKDVVQCA